MTIARWLQTARSQLTKADITSAQLDAELILAHVLGKSREWLLAHSNDEIQTTNLKVANALLNKRTKRHPLVHLTGQREFYGLALEITPDVLTPRVETELIVEQVIQQAPQNGSVLDVGTGSGAIAIAIKKHRPDLVVTASDISKPALAVAKRNAQKHSCQIKFVESDLLIDVHGRFDVITANLPYLTNQAELMPEVQREPQVALLGGPDGLNLYRQFFSQLPSHLMPTSTVFVEADPWQHQELTQIAQRQHLNTQLDDYFIMSFSASP